jgi:beta-mannosidase
MNRAVLSICLLVLVFGPLNSCWAASANTPNHEMGLTSGWRITQDVRQLGEENGWYKTDFAADWQPIDRLAHLQLLLAHQPYFGRDLRYFNEAPWWYRLEFSVPKSEQKSASRATLRFDGVDYFAKVWLNGTLLGEHEGYADPFTFEVGNLLNADKPNVLVVKVSSPWDHKYENPSRPIFSVVRNLLKGSYEHADTFVQRDVNPVGIWRPVELIFHQGVREADPPSVTTSLSDDQKTARTRVTWHVFNDNEFGDVSYIVHIKSKENGAEVAKSTQQVRLEHGDNTLQAKIEIPSPKLWNTWDRGGQPLYTASLEIVQSQVQKLTESVTFGIRTVELRRTADETRFFINGEPVYLRGATYWPDLYLSNMDRARYERDLQAAVHAGINALRIHVHTENPEFYELCDRMGIVLLQDNDLNWVFPTDPEFTDRAVHHFGTMIKMLRNHPSIIAWIAMNEASIFPNDKGTKAISTAPGPQLVAEEKELDPTRPVIKDSMDSKDLESGDTHDYRGSLNGGGSQYMDIFGSKTKLVTEFGVDAPPAASSLRALPEVADRLSDVLPRVSELHDYQYHLLKYYIEHYRIQKYSPNAGYFLFMWIDFSPQSFYGVYDYWGAPKVEGLGGGLRALEESNQPIGIFMEYKDAPVALYAVNDSSTDLGKCVAHWHVSSSEGVIVDSSQTVQLGPDSHQKIGDLKFEVKDGESYEVTLDLLSAEGKLLAHNTYLDPFHPQPRPKGYPERIDDELGMRLWWAGENEIK